jgi:hypothetical protein
VNSTNSFASVIVLSATVPATMVAAVAAKANREGNTAILPALLRSAPLPSLDSPP